MFGHSQSANETCGLWLVEILTMGSPTRRMPMPGMVDDFIVISKNTYKCKRIASILLKLFISGLSTSRQLRNMIGALMLGALITMLQPYIYTGF